MHDVEYASIASVDATSLVDNVTEHVRRIMSQPPYDCSHDMGHVQRVVALAERIAIAEQQSYPDRRLDRLLIRLTALLHDIGDSKYVSPDVVGPSVQSILLNCSAPASLATTIEKLVQLVSCTHEIAHPEAVAAALVEYPELGIVQDADRLDAIGAIGIGRAFTYGGAHGRTLDQTRSVFESKLLLREGMMKTVIGQQMAHERCQRLRDFMRWWNEEYTSAAIV